MPYIAPALRDVFDPYINAIIAEVRYEHKLPPSGVVKGVLLRLTASTLVVKLDVDINVRIEILIDELAYHVAVKANHGIDGILNYCVSRIVAGCYLPEPKQGKVSWPYFRIARVINVLERAKLDAYIGMLSTGPACESLVAVFEAAKLEFYARVAVPKEAIAQHDNGDIPEYSSQFCLTPLEAYL